MMQINIKHKFLAPKFLLLTSLGILLTSCGADLTTVKKFGESAGTVKASAERMAHDIYESCIRSTYLPTTPFPNSIGVQTIQDQQKECAKKLAPEAEVETVKNANFVLINYMIALGKLASEDTVSFEKNLNSLEASVKGLNTSIGKNALTDREVTAGLQIARFVFNRLVEQFRQENVKEAIVCTNPYLQEYIPGLITIVQDYYIGGVIRSEGIDIDQYYSKYNSVSNRAEQFPVEQSYLEKAKELIHERIDSGKDYMTILSQTKKSHQALFNEFNQPVMTKEQLNEYCKPYFSQDEKVTHNLPKTQLTARQIKRVQEIVLDYQSKVEPLAKKLEHSFR